MRYSFVIVVFLLLSCTEITSQLLYRDYDYNENIDIEAGYFHYRDVSDVLLGRVGWNEKRIKPEEIAHVSLEANTVILIRLRNNDKRTAWGTLKIKDNPDAPIFGTTLQVMLYQAAEPKWVIYAVSPRTPGVVLKKQVSEGPFVSWHKLHTHGK